MYDEKCWIRIGPNIKVLRTINRIRQVQMAEALGVSQTHLSNIESGRVNVNVPLLVKAANLLHCSIDDFLHNAMSIDETTEMTVPDTDTYSAEEVQLMLKMLKVGKNSRPAVRKKRAVKRSD
ncbi:helix-turn-helix domain-containing protein [uncultured Phascolarctobacterium sp.]|uniref:helix-turn-helix domain-containing protein n=1 Tax=uncultured Phascolarctobacterium sp. TaxID=512296 RepID=UPI0027D95AE6|nr:helix-turn-helix domain-containing protein [uncultured Phascolarctobacterium sp.]